MSDQPNHTPQETQQPVYRSEEFPVASRPGERTAAQARRNAFPYRFPRDPRQMGGKYDVTENARRLMRFFYLERRLMQAIGAWTLAIAEFEVKVESGRHLFYHADAARFLRERLHEQEQRLATIDGYRNEEIDRFIDEMLSASDTPEFLIGLHQVAGRALETAYRHHIDEARARNDAILVHIADFIRSDERTHVRKGQHIIRVMTDLGMQELELKTRELFTECLVSLGAWRKDMDLFLMTREDIEQFIGE